MAADQENEQPHPNQEDIGPNDGDNQVGESQATPDDGYGLLDPPAEWAAADKNWNTVIPMANTSTRNEFVGKKPRGKRTTASDIWALAGCNLTVFVSSVCIMVLELTASRLIARHVGSSLYTWTSVIGVVLAGITIGNYIGGFMADRVSPRKALGWLFLVSSILCLSVLWLNQFVPSTERPDGMNWPMWVFYVVGSIFLLPSIALGTISPVVASIALSRSTKIGITVGNVYAWGALGSIAGTFLAGFWLIGAFGCNAIVVLTSGTLAAMGILVVSHQYAFRAAVLFGWLQFVALTGLVSTAKADTLSNLAWKLTGAPDRATFEELESWVEEESPRPLDPRTHSELTAWFRQGLMDDWDDAERVQLADWLEAEPHVNLDGATRKHLQEWLFGIGSNESVNFWTNFGKRLGDNFHTLGLTLKLRDDDPSEYHDESNYSYINVSYDTEDGDEVMFLKLDKLIHSYYNPSKPTELYYDYEQIYAAVTERVTSHRHRKISTRLEAFESQEEVLQNLPPWIRFDPESESLEVDGPMTEKQRDKLLSLSPIADYIRAVEDLYRLTNVVDWGGFSSAELTRLPDDVTIPESLDTKLIFDPNLQVMIAHDVVTDEDRRQLLKAGYAGQSFGFYRTVLSLYKKSRSISTMFIGGGGFIFPRWIEAKYPGDPIIDVAELDPAVKLAVQREMGLPPDHQTLIKTHIGDARNFVDDRLRENIRLRKENKPPRLYDFVYGDAFNDFSVPWHLTTKEFCEKVKNLLTPDGVYLVNIIDIYPRSVYPPQDQDGDGTDEPFRARIPSELLVGSAMSLEWEGCSAPFIGMEVLQDEEAGAHIFAARGVLTDSLRDRLLSLEPDNFEFNGGVHHLYRQSRQNAAGRFLGSYVNTLKAVFPNVYLFSSETVVPHDGRDTFVVVGSMHKIDMSDLADAGGYWTGQPFAWWETNAATGKSGSHGQFEMVSKLADGMELTDDFAPVDNMLSPVFKDQE